MEKTCYRCEAPLPENAPFCPACGAPQIRVSAQELTPAAPPPESQSGPPEFTYNPPGPAFVPGAIRWKLFLRTIWPIAALGGIAVSSIPAIGFFVLLPISVVAGIWLYRKRHGASVRAGQGMKLGLAMGLMSFAVSSVFFVIDVSTSDKLRQDAIDALKQTAARAPDPQTQQMFLSWANNPHAVGLFLAFGLAAFLAVFLGFTALTGAVAAATLGDKKP
jgi:ribosomal protein L40E